MLATLSTTVEIAGLELDLELEVSGEYADHGIGAFEYWGARGVHHEWGWDDLQSLQRVLRTGRYQHRLAPAPAASEPQAVPKSRPPAAAANWDLDGSSRGEVGFRQRKRLHRRLGGAKRAGRRGRPRTWTVSVRVRRMKWQMRVSGLVACESGLRFPCRGLGLLPKGGSSPASKALKWRSMGTKQSEPPRQRTAFGESRQERPVLTLSLGVSRAIIPFWPLGKSG